MDTRASVKVKNPEHPRADHAGVIQAQGDEPGAVLVKWDDDDTIEVVATDDLVVLSQN